MARISHKGQTLPAAFVTYGWCRSSYTVVKSLAKRGVTVHVGDSSPVAMSRWSRYSQKFWQLPDFYLEPDAYINALGKALHQSGARVLLPCFEDIELVIRHRDKLPDGTLIAVPGITDWMSAEDKYEYAKVLEPTACPVPATLKVDSRDELPDAAHELGFPLLVKIRSGNGSRGVSIVRQRSDLESVFFGIVDQFQLERNRWPVLQRHLAGTKFKQEGIFCQGRSLASVVYKILRCKGPNLFGTSTFRETVDHPQLSGFAVEALGAFNWNGVYNTDFICDEHGIPHLIDINGRLSGAIAICYAAGVDIPWMWYQMALKNVPNEVQAAVGVRARWLLGDMIGIVQHLRAGAFGQLLSIFKPEFCYHDDFSWSDPLPFLGEASDYFYKFIQSRGSFTPTTKGMIR